MEWAQLYWCVCLGGAFSSFHLPASNKPHEKSILRASPYLSLMTFLLVFPQLGLELITFLKRSLLRRFGFYCRFPNEFIIQILLLSKAYLPGFVKFVIKLLLFINVLLNIFCLRFSAEKDFPFSSRRHRCRKIWSPTHASTFFLRRRSYSSCQKVFLFLKQEMRFVEPMPCVLMLHEHHHGAPFMERDALSHQHRCSGRKKA